MATNGTYVEQTEEEKVAETTAAIKDEVEKDGAAIIYANEKRLQLFRHKPGQLDTCKDEDGSRLEQLNRERMELKKRSDAMERNYWAKKENSLVGQIVRKKLGMRGQINVDASEDDAHPAPQHDQFAATEAPAKTVKISD